MSLARPSLVASILCVAACASSPPPTPAPAPPPRAAAPATCAPGTPREPPGVREKMSKLGDDVKRCYLLGGRTDEAVTLRTELVVSDDGRVKKATLTGSPASRKDAADCATKVLEGARFEAFCGDDVALGWTFALR